MVKALEEMVQIALLVHSLLLVVAVVEFILVLFLVRLVDRVAALVKEVHLHLVVQELQDKAIMVVWLFYVGPSDTRSCGGGGGAGAVGGTGTATHAGNGGIGIVSTILGAPLYWAAGGGGGQWNAPNAGNGGLGGGGGGGNAPGTSRTGSGFGLGGGSALSRGGDGRQVNAAEAGGGNGGVGTGGGGGGSGQNQYAGYSNPLSAGGRGGSGIAIFRWT